MTRELLRFTLRLEVPLDEFQGHRGVVDLDFFLDHAARAIQRGPPRSVFSQSEANRIVDVVREAYPSQEIELQDGGQPHYQFIVSVE